MRAALLVVILIMTTADHVTTYLCLTESPSGFTVTEANPAAAWLFSHAGLIQGLALDTLLTCGALLFLTATTRFTPMLKTGLLGFVAAATSLAVVNNVFAIIELGILPFGAA
jgi:hypothetical protein